MTMPTQQCAREDLHTPHVWEGFVTDPEVSLAVMYYACPGLAERLAYLPPSLYNSLMDFLLKQPGREALELADALAKATGASTLQRRGREGL